MQIKPTAWRRGLLLSATFLLMVFVSLSCKKKENLIGQNTIDQNELLNSAGIDTFTLLTHTIKVDSSISDNAAYGIIGSYNDPVFGIMQSEIYTQFRLSVISPDFGTDPIDIDSVVLGLEYVNYYGTVGPQTFEVYEINDPDGLSLDSTYYNTRTISTTGINIIETGMETIDMDPNQETVIDGDTVEPQMRIHLDTMFAWNMIQESFNNPSTFESNENFQQYFKGLHIKPNNPLQSSGEGGMFYLNLNAALSKLTIYYHQNGVQYTFDLLINAECADFNHVEINNSGTPVEALIIDSTLGQVEFYAQAFGSRGVIRIPGIDNIPKNAVIHKATLELPVQYLSGSQYDPGGALTTVVTADEDENLFYAVAPITIFDDYTKRYDIDLRSYVQNILNGTIANKDIIVYPSLFISSADRIIFNGPDTDNKVKPKFSIIYTEY